MLKKLKKKAMMKAAAVARLAAEGLVDVIPQAGTFVARFSMEEIREGAFLREAIESAAIERLAEVITDEQLTQLRRNLTVQAALVADGDVPGFYQMDAAMHEMLLSFTGFRKLAQVSETAWLHVNRARQLILPVPGRVQATVEEHRAILAALEARDPEAARRAVRWAARRAPRRYACCTVCTRTAPGRAGACSADRKSTRLNSSH